MDFNRNSTTPSKITRGILAFCSEIDSTSSPIFVPVEPVDDVRFNYCLTDVPLYSQKNGGNTQFGWIIWECPKVFLEAEFHTCWLNPENKLIDITPKPNNENQILFLPDSQRIYEHKAVANRRKALIDNEFTRLWLKCEQKKDEIRTKHFRNDEVDAVAAAAEFENWLASISPGKKRIARNDPCPCGSGLKYKKCCLKS
jgi:hypothetical protein